jgi:hypothetical protein
MHSDPELETTIFRYILVCTRECILHLGSAPDGIDGARELGQDTVASGVRDPPTVFDNEPIHDLTMGGQGAEGADLILLHHARIACHVSREDGGQPPLDLVLLWTHETLGAVPHRFCCGWGTVSSLRRMGKRRVYSSENRAYEIRYVTGWLKAKLFSSGSLGWSTLAG